MSNEKANKKIELLEFIIAIMLGITTVATAWSAWQGGLHGSQMDQKYTKSNNLAAEGNSEYNAAIQTLMEDSMIYNEINSLLIDMHFADSKGDQDEYDKLEWKFEELLYKSASLELEEAIHWALKETERLNETISPFEKEGFVDSYFEIATELLAESEEMLEEGNKNNTHSDNQGLVSVIYSIVLFLLGIAASFKGLREKNILLALSCVGFLAATIFMFTIPIVLP